VPKEATPRIGSSRQAKHGQCYSQSVFRLLLVSVQEGFDVLGGYMSPVNDAYGKPDLAPATHRSAAARLVSLRFLRLDHQRPAALKGPCPWQVN
jgi:hypothetical protein